MLKKLGKLSDYKGEITALIIGIIASSIANIITNTHEDFVTLDPKEKVLITVGTFVIIILLFLLFNFKRLTDYRYRELKDFIVSRWGHTVINNQFHKRSSHFANEKCHLAEQFLLKELPRVIEEISLKESPEYINIFIDAGTTMFSLFAEIKKMKQVTSLPVKIRIITNNLSGIQELFELSNFDNNFDEKCQIVLVGGKPIAKYSATTGDIAEKFLQMVIDDLCSEKSQNISLVTANWFLIGKRANNISVCARGNGHLIFKEKLIENSKYVYLITPLGKLTLLDNVEELNKILPVREEKYKSFEIDNKDKTVKLFTTYRDNLSQSKLKTLTNIIKDHDSESANYELSENNSTFSACFGRKDCMDVEFPHTYTRNYLGKLYHC